MSRTYKFPTKNFEYSSSKDDFNANLKIHKWLERQKHRKKRKIQARRSFMKLISFRDKQRARV